MQKVVVLIAALLWSPPPASGGQDQLIYMDGLPENLHHATLTENQAIFVVNQVCERLVAYDAEGQFRPEIASSWEFSRSGKRLVFHLRPGVSFSDGVRLSPRHLRASLEQTLQAKIVHGFRRILGAAEFVSGRDRELRGLRFPKPGVMEVHFDRPNFQALMDFADVHSAVCRYQGGVPVGTGAYRIDQRTPDTLLLEHIRPGPRSLRRVRLTKDRRAAVFLSLCGQHRPAGADRTSSYYRSAVDFLGFHADHPNVTRVEERRYVINLLRSELGDSRGEYRLGGFIPLGLPGHSPSLEPPLAGPSSQPRKPLEIKYYRTDFEPMMEKIGRRLGLAKMEHRIEKLTFANFIQHSKRGELSVFLARLHPSAPSALDLLSVFYTDSSLNYFFSPSSQLGNRIAAGVARAAHTPDSLIDETRTIDALLNEHLILIPFRYGGMQQIYFRSGFKIPPLGPLGWVDLRLVEMERG